MPHNGELQMSKKGREKFRIYEMDSFSDDDTDYDDFDQEALSRDIHSIERDEIFEKEERFSTRRKIERRNDMKQLHAQFDDWDDTDYSHHW